MPLDNHEHLSMFVQIKVAQTKRRPFSNPTTTFFCRLSLFWLYMGLVSGNLFMPNELLLIPKTFPKKENYLHPPPPKNLNKKELIFEKMKDFSGIFSLCKYFL